MPNSVAKFLHKLDSGRREVVLEILARIHGGDLQGLDCRKLKGFDHQYRVRVGDIRILFFRDANKRPMVFDIGFRNDTTYR